MLPDPHTENVLTAIHGDAKNHIGRLRHISVILLDLVMDRVHKDEGIDAFQRSVLPRRDLRHDLLTDFADQLRRNFHII